MLKYLINWGTWMEEITLKKTIETAIKAEELGISFYSELSKLFGKDTELKEMFELLAKDEVEHKRQFTELLKSVADEDVQINDVDKEFMQGIDISKYFEFMESVDTNVKPSAVLMRAYAFEKESVLYYSGIRDIIGSSLQLDAIIQLEKMHMIRIMKYIVSDSKFRGISDEWK